MKLTIITINYNNAAGLQKTMESVLNQTSLEFEYIVVDGTKTSPPTPLTGERGADREVLRSFVAEELEYVNGFSSCKWHSALAEGVIGGGFYSESDSGIYNAMNKGIRMAKGEYVQFLNSGDILAASNVTERMLQDMPECAVLSGDMKLFKNGVEVKWSGPRTDNISFKTFYKGSLNHSTSYIRKDLFDKYGYYDESLKIVSDWKFFLLTLGLYNEKLVLKKLIVTHFDLSGISSVNLELRNKERRKVLEELVPKPILMDYDQMYDKWIMTERLIRIKSVQIIMNLLYRIIIRWDKLYYRYK